MISPMPIQRSITAVKQDCDRDGFVVLRVHDALTVHWPGPNRYRGKSVGKSMKSAPSG